MMRLSTQKKIKSICESSTILPKGVTQSLWEGVINWLIWLRLRSESKNIFGQQLNRCWTLKREGKKTNNPYWIQSIEIQIGIYLSLCNTWKLSLSFIKSQLLDNCTAEIELLLSLAMLSWACSGWKYCHFKWSWEAINWRKTVIVSSTKCPLTKILRQRLLMNHH